MSRRMWKYLISSLPLSRSFRIRAVRDCDGAASPRQTTLPDIAKLNATASVQQCKTRGQFTKSVISWPAFSFRSKAVHKRPVCSVLSVVLLARDVDQTAKMAEVSSPTLDSQKGDFEIARCWRHGQFWLWAAGHSTARSTYTTAIALPWDPGRAGVSQLTLLGGLARHDVRGKRLSFGAQKCDRAMP